MPLEEHPDPCPDPPVEVETENDDDSDGPVLFVPLSLAQELGLSHVEHVHMESAVFRNFLHVLGHETLSDAQRDELIAARLAGGNVFFSLLAQHLGVLGPSAVDVVDAAASSWLD